MNSDKPKYFAEKIRYKRNNYNCYINLFKIG